MRYLRRRVESFDWSTRRLIRAWLESNIPRVLAWTATGIYGFAADRRRWRQVLARSSAHIGVVGVAILAIGLSNAKWSAQAAASLGAPEQPATAGSDDRAASLENEMAQVVLTELGQHAEVSFDEDAPIVRRGEPHTVIPDRPRLGVTTYTVKAGDTLQGIAAIFELQPTTLQWANPRLEDAPDLLRIGQVLRILPIDGVYHEVVEGDTLESIAAEDKVDVDAIANCPYNSLKSRRDSLVVGGYLIVPGGKKPYVPKVVRAYTGDIPAGALGSGQFQWPVLGVVTQGYWYGHRAIDIGAPIGSAILAADSGFVSFAGWTDVGYGYLVVVNHNNGFSTYYAHCSNIYVYEGQPVDRGQVIAAVGSTGHSTGPHLHFEIRYGGVPQNPFAYLP